jgi:MHS family proline/betaine transporter-like MFS transporter
MTETTQAPSRRKTIIAGVAGNVLEWYDFAVYGFFAPIIAQQFFPSDDPTVSLIATFGAFAAGFLMRPVGGAFFGHIGDKLGRQKALMLSVMMMAVPTFLIGFLPTYETIGIAAAVLMVLLRMAQGLAVGGEYTSSVVFLAEQAPRGKRGFFASWAMWGGVAGTMLGSAVGAGLSNIIPHEDLISWGWRCAFLGGIVVALFGYVIRRHMGTEDSPKPEASPIKLTFTKYLKPMLRLSALNIVSAISFYLMFVYIVTWLVDYRKEPNSTALDINTAAMAVLLVFIPIAAIISDRWGRKKMMLLGMGGLAIFAYPLLTLMHQQDAMMIFLGQVGFAALIATFMSVIPAAMAEMFPSEVRVTAVSIGYNLTFAIFGGTAPMVAVWLIERTHDDMAFGWYMSAMAVVAFLVALTLKDKRNEPLED